MTLTIFGAIDHSVTAMIVSSMDQVMLVVSLSRRVRNCIASEQARFSALPRAGSGQLRTLVTTTGLFRPRPAAPGGGPHRADELKLPVRHHDLLYKIQDTRYLPLPPTRSVHKRGLFPICFLLSFISPHSSFNAHPRALPEPDARSALILVPVKSICLPMCYVTRWASGSTGACPV